MDTRSYSQSTGQSGISIPGSDGIQGQIEQLDSSQRIGPVDMLGPRGWIDAQCHHGLTNGEGLTVGIGKAERSRVRQNSRIDRRREA